VRSRGTRPRARRGRGAEHGVGVSACFKPWGTVALGAGIDFGDTGPTVLGRVCDMDRFQEHQVPKGSLSAPSGGTTVASGLPAAVFAFTGNGAPPNVVMVAPDGTQFASDDTSRPESFLPFGDPATSTAYLAIRAPRGRHLEAVPATRLVLARRLRRV
jgi:hypothetical protein